MNVGVGLSGGMGGRGGGGVGGEGYAKWKKWTGVYDGAAVGGGLASGGI